MLAALAAHDGQVGDGDGALVSCEAQLPGRGARPVWRAGQRGRSDCLAEAGRGWPRLDAALSLIWCWRGVSKLEAESAEASGAAGFHMDMDMGMDMGSCPEPGEV